MQLLFHLCSVKMDFVDVDPIVLLTAHWILIDLRKMTLTAQLHLQRQLLFQSEFTSAFA